MVDLGFISNAYCIIFSVFVYSSFHVITIELHLNQRIKYVLLLFFISRGYAEVWLKSEP